MTNEQLSLLINAWAQRLGREIDLLRSALPDEMERLKESKYTGTALLGVVTDSNPEHWVTIDGDFAALQGLEGLKVELEQAVQTLQAPKG